MKQLNDTNELDALQILVEKTLPEAEDVIPTPDFHPSSLADNTLWEEFKNLMETRKSQQIESKPKLFCRIESDLAYTLDLCRVNGAARTEMINGILRVFIHKYLKNFAEYRKVNHTLLDDDDVTQNS